MSLRKICSIIWASLCVSHFALAQGDLPPVADTVLSGGKIVTLDPEHPEVEAIAIKDGKILAVGDEASLAGYVDPATTRQISLQGQLVVPGFVESHAHLLNVGTAALSLDLSQAASEADAVAKVFSLVAETPAGSWIEGRGWDQNTWDKPAFPTLALLSAATPEHPVYLSRVDGHAAWVNRRALQLAGINRKTPDPSGGRIIRDANGEPTGVLIDSAMGLVARLIPPMSQERLQSALHLAMEIAARNGITSFHDAGSSRRVVAALEKMAAEGPLPLRVYAMLSSSDTALVNEYFRSGPKIGLADDTLTIRSIKLFADGALGSRGAALLDDYSDEPGQRGLLMIDKATLTQKVARAIANGFQVATHAIGDRANRMVLDSYEEAMLTRSPLQDLRLRIEHAQVIDRDDVPRFAQLGVIASMQSTHCTSDMPWVPERLGQRRTDASAYVWQSLLQSGAHVANGSDAPVEALNPLAGLYAAITRQDARGLPPLGWNPEQRMSRLEALRSFTIEGAFASFQEAKLGSLSVGKLADLVVLSKDVMTVPVQEILQTEVVMTMRGGQEIYRVQRSH